ncbi:acyl-CoA dehydrogenase family protein [Actinomadura parmotrematis]|uniref:Acyl-CoA/acyl-ACP dehydrogenase n=1 Tax=Actinomadura parmotrematis TaxID=2864039 RepID=A0ABS7FYF3_9ACTN|nr:acyl-CoA dehydrogenase family protein [Actinomadura parmotrematis]MBW8485465.1 acyl-CoA/acyl-ACP dehydrogenase [Actinomadura parmotrematis]
MRLVATEEQRELRGTLRRFLADRSPGGEVRRLMAAPEGHDPEVWALMAEQLGLQGLAVAEEHGGAGYGTAELAVVFEEMGRALLCSPFLATTVAAAAVAACGDAAFQAGALPGLADGTTIATLAWSEAAPAVEARRDGDGWTLHGAADRVLDGHLADLVLVPARTGAGTRLFAVRDGFARTPLTTLDQTRRLARLEFADTPARALEGDADAALGHALDAASVALAAEALGGAQRMLDLTVEYVKVRKQFGRAIGSFQAIKHRCADLFVLVESSRSAVMAAAATADEDPARLPAAASVAKAYCTDAYFQVAGEAVQLHGGIGFTWEHDAHLHFKRAKSCQALFGSPAWHRRRLDATALAPSGS